LSRERYQIRAVAIPVLVQSARQRRLTRVSPASARAASVAKIRKPAW
jgi:hypothetical protein